MKSRILLFAACYLTIVFLFPLHTANAGGSRLNLSGDFWTMFAGYGMSHKGLGATRTAINTIDATWQYAHFLSEIKNNSWYAGKHHLLIELPFNTVIHPRPGIITGINFLASWIFTSYPDFSPYVFAGGGPAYTNLKTAGIGSEFNGSYQAGVGVFLHFMKTEMVLNYRIIHVSNGGIAKPNEPVNASYFLIGIPLVSDD